MRKGNVAIGEDFEILDVSTVDSSGSDLADDEARHKRAMRKMLTLVFLVGFAVFLGGATAYGWYDGSFDEVNNVWAVGAVWLGFIFRSYFGGRID